MGVEIQHEHKASVRTSIDKIREHLDNLEYELSWKEVNANRANKIMSEASGLAQRAQRETCKMYSKELRSEKKK